MPNDESSINEVLHEVRNQLTIVKSKLFLADNSIKSTDFYKEMTQHIHTLSAQLHELSLLQELESGVYPFKSEEVALLPLMSNVASLAPLNKKVLYEEANATLTLDKELAFQLSAIILNSAWQLGAKTVQITTDGKAIVFTFDAGDSQVVMSKPKQQLCAQICSVHDGLLTIARNDANAIVTCRLSP